MSALVSVQGSAKRRRALNQVWAAAGSYGFEPLFLALDSKGVPDFYMNCVVGLVQKWYGDDMPKALFGWWAGDFRQAMLDDLAWLALESAAYSRELPIRPILSELRRGHAEGFFAQEHQLSRQEWMAKNQLAYTMQVARWKAVLGKRPPIMTSWEKRLYQSLSPEAKLDAKALDAAIRQVFLDFGLFGGEVRKKRALRLHFRGRWAWALTKFMPTELTRTERLSVNRSDSTDSGSGLLVDARNVRFHLKNHGKSDREYIESCFGKSLFPPEQLLQVEQALCKGIHLGCRLWFTDGTQSPDCPPTGEAKRLAEQAALQYGRSRAAYQADIELHRSAILRLTEQIQNCILIHHQPQARTARAGRLDCTRVWRQVRLGDERVFRQSDEENRPGFSVDLLLDASASRLHCQEIVAAQGYILSESLSRCGIPVRVSSFCSLRGYTVLQVLKGYADKGGGQRIFRYFASGWNRDGLALRAAGELLKDAPTERRLLVVLTDASPNDSRRIPPDAKNPFGQNYEGKAGTLDAAAEVHSLRGRGIRVAAVFHGENVHFPNARMIYGRELAHIQRMDQLAAAAGRLIQDEIRELSG